MLNSNETVAIVIGTCHGIMVTISIRCMYTGNRCKFISHHLVVGDLSYSTCMRSYPATTTQIIFCRQCHLGETPGTAWFSP